MTATDISLNGSLPAHGPILYDVIFICVYTSSCTFLFYMANGLNKELLNLNVFRNSPTFSITDIANAICILRLSVESLNCSHE